MSNLFSSSWLMQAASVSFSVFCVLCLVVIILLVRSPRSTKKRKQVYKPAPVAPPPPPPAPPPPVVHWELNISGKDPEIHGVALAHQNLYRRLYGPRRHYRHAYTKETNFLMEVEHYLTRPYWYSGVDWDAEVDDPEIQEWLVLLKASAAKIEAEAFDFSDPEQLRIDEERFARRIEGIRDSSEFEDRIYELHDMAIMLRNLEGWEEKLDELATKNAGYPYPEIEFYDHAKIMLWREIPPYLVIDALEEQLRVEEGRPRGRNDW